MAIRVNSENFDKEVLQSKLPVLVDFYSDSCVPCKMIAPILCQIESENSDTLKVVKVNVNYDLDLAEQFDLQTTPTLIYYKNGEEKARHRGAARKDEIEAIIK
ncbi:MAG: thioredoxin family protein [Acutalibacteraceae bacterium]|nr:thioredoxin family protein [Acutalibacteraceae bacterium]